MAEELTKEEKQRLKEERRKAFEAAHPELAAKRKEADQKKQKVQQKKEEVVIQGDVMDEVETYIHSLLEEKGLKDVKVETIDAKKKKKPAAEGAAK